MHPRPLFPHALLPGCSPPTPVYYGNTRVPRPQHPNASLLSRSPVGLCLNYSCITFRKPLCFTQGANNNICKAATEKDLFMPQGLLKHKVYLKGRNIILNLLRCPWVSWWWWGFKTSLANSGFIVILAKKKKKKMSTSCREVTIVTV